MDNTNQSGLQIRKGFVLHGRNLARACFASVNVALGFEMDLNGRCGSVVGVLQQLAKHWALALRLSASTVNMGRHTSELAEIPRQYLIDECPLVHFDKLVVSRTPLYGLIRATQVEGWDGALTTVFFAFVAMVGERGLSWAVAELCGILGSTAPAPGLMEIPGTYT